MAPPRTNMRARAIQPKNRHVYPTNFDWNLPSCTTFSPRYRYLDEKEIKPVYRTAISALFRPFWSRSLGWFLTCLTVLGAPPHACMRIAQRRPSFPRVFLFFFFYILFLIGACNPIYPTCGSAGFGFGLSYSRFGYSGLKMAAPSHGSVTATVTVTNSGDRDGDEVVQVGLFFFLFFLFFPPFFGAGGNGRRCCRRLCGKS